MASLTFLHYTHNPVYQFLQDELYQRHVNRLSEIAAGKKARKEGSSPPRDAAPAGPAQPREPREPAKRAPRKLRTKESVPEELKNAEPQTRHTHPQPGKKDPEARGGALPEIAQTEAERQKQEDDRKKIAFLRLAQENKALAYNMLSKQASYRPLAPWERQFLKRLDQDIRQRAEMEQETETQRWLREYKAMRKERAAQVASEYERPPPPPPPQPMHSYLSRNKERNQKAGAKLQPMKLEHKGRQGAGARPPREEAAAQGGPGEKDDMKALLGDLLEMSEEELLRMAGGSAEPDDQQQHAKREPGYMKYDFDKEKEEKPLEASVRGLVEDTLKGVDKALTDEAAGTAREEPGSARGAAPPPEPAPPPEAKADPEPAPAAPAEEGYGDDAFEAEAGAVQEDKGEEPKPDPAPAVETAPVAPADKEGYGDDAFEAEAEGVQEEKGAEAGEAKPDPAPAAEPAPATAEDDAERPVPGDDGEGEEKGREEDYGGDDFEADKPEEEVAEEGSRS
eukprot:tig00020943_g16273.t1